MVPSRRFAFASASAEKSAAAPSPSRHTSSHRAWSHSKRGGDGVARRAEAERSASARFSPPRFLPWPFSGPPPVHSPPPVIAIGVLCGTLTTRTGCLFRNFSAGYASSCASFPPESKTAPAPRFASADDVPLLSSDGGAAAIASARTSCVCGRFAAVNVHLYALDPADPASPETSAALSKTAICESTPDANTARPSGDVASARTSALCCLCALIFVACSPSQKVTSPSLLPLTSVPHGRYCSAHTQRSSASRAPGRSPAPTVILASSAYASQSNTWMAPRLDPAAIARPSCVHASESSRPSTRLKLRRWCRPAPTPSPPASVKTRTHPSSHAAATRAGDRASRGARRRAPRRSRRASPWRPGRAGCSGPTP